jgi:hypothetical protein
LNRLAQTFHTPLAVILGMKSDKDQNEFIMMYSKVALVGSEALKPEITPVTPR